MNGSTLRPAFPLLVSLGLLCWCTSGWGGEASPGDPYWLDVTKNCGPVCVYMVDSYLGGDRSYEQIAASCPPGIDGVSLAAIRDAFGALNYHTCAFQASLSCLRGLSHPALVRYEWSTDQQKMERGKVHDHFVVLLGWDDRTERFQVFDPPRSLSWIPYEEVERHYAGIGLVVSNEPLPPLKELLKSPSRWPLVMGGAVWALMVGGVLWMRRRHIPSGTANSVVPVLVIAIVTFQSSGCTRTSAPSQTTSETVFDAGDVPSGEPLKHVFRIKNPSDRPLRFERITSTCGCRTGLVGDFPREVDAGEFAEAEVELSTAELGGPIERKFVIVTDAAEAKHKALPFILRANVIRPIKLTPEEIDFGTVHPGAVSERTFLMRFNPPGLADTFRGIACEADNVEAAVSGRAEDMIKVAVRLTAPDEAGTLGGSVRLEFTGGGQSPIRVPVRGLVQGPLRTTPARFFVDPAEGTQEQRMRIASAGGEPFRILSIDYPPGIEATVVRAGTGDAAAAAQQFLLLRATSVSAIPPKATLRIRTDHAQNPELLVAVQVVSQGAPTTGER